MSPQEVSTHHHHQNNCLELCAQCVILATSFLMLNWLVKIIQGEDDASSAYYVLSILVLLVHGLCVGEGA